jgi:hypothetical protein
VARHCRATRSGDRRHAEPELERTFSETRSVRPKKVNAFSENLSFDRASKANRLSAQLLRIAEANVRRCA